MEKIRIRDPGWKKVRSGIRNKHSEHWLKDIALLFRIVKSVWNVQILTEQNAQREPG
jgi:hypothetical protein